MLTRRFNWEALERFLTDGRIPIDNNATERDLRGVAIGRKNWMFIGSRDAGERTESILAVLSSAQRHDLDMRAYLADVLPAWADYGRVSLIKANWIEATEAASCGNPRPLALARKLSDAHRCDIVITLGRCGMVCAERSGATWYLPARPVEVRDVCGAGDTVFAAIAQGIVTRKSLRNACRSSMGAAGRQVASLGIGAVA